LLGPISKSWCHYYVLFSCANLRKHQNHNFYDRSRKDKYNFFISYLKSFSFFFWTFAPKGYSILFMHLIIFAHRTLFVCCLPSSLWFLRSLFSLVNILSKIIDNMKSFCRILDRLYKYSFTWIRRSIFLHYYFFYDCLILFMNKFFDWIYFIQNGIF